MRMLNKRHNDLLNVYMRSDTKEMTYTSKIHNYVHVMDAFGGMTSTVMLIAGYIAGKFSGT